MPRADGSGGMPGRGAVPAAVSDLGVGPGAAEQEALAFVAALAAQAAQFGLGLDAFGGDRHAEAAAERDDRADDRLRIVIGIEVAHERLVDLDLVERERAQIAQRRVAGAEIVHRDAHASARSACCVAVLVALVEQQGLGDFDLEPLRRGRRP